MSYHTPTTIDWLTKASATDTRDCARSVTDIAVLEKALAIVQGKEKTKARIIEARIKSLRKKTASPVA